MSLSVAAETCLASRCLAMNFSRFQASCHSIFLCCFCFYIQIFYSLFSVSFINLLLWSSHVVTPCVCRRLWFLSVPPLVHDFFLSNPATRCCSFVTGSEESVWLRQGTRNVFVMQLARGEWLSHWNGMDVWED
jgi:hypothetical protein